MTAPTQAILKELFRYDPYTGEFVWIKLSGRTGNKRLLGAVAGHRDRKGYVRINISGKLYAAHRLAWLYVHGAFPADEIDHINGNRSDNRIANLREATTAENCRNRKCRSDNTSGHKGVSWHSRDRRWQAYIEVDGKFHYLGLHKTEEAAAAAYAAAAVEKHGKFARLA